MEDKSLWIRKTSQKICFVQLTKNGTGYLHFTNNKAGLTGNALYGGWIDVCVRKGVDYTVSNIFSFDDSKSLTDISSNPSRVCICIDSVPNRYQDSENISLFPGQSLTINAMAVGQMFGLVSAIVRAEVKNKQFSIIDDL